MKGGRGGVGWGLVEVRRAPALKERYIRGEGER